MNKLTLRILFVISAASMQGAGFYDLLAHYGKVWSDFVVESPAFQSSFWCGSSRPAKELEFEPKIPRFPAIDANESATDLFSKLETLQLIESNNLTESQKLHNLLINQHRKTMGTYYVYTEQGENTLEEACNRIQHIQIEQCPNKVSDSSSAAPLREKREQLKQAQIQAKRHIRATSAIVKFIHQNCKDVGLRNIANAVHEVISKLALSETCEFDFTFIQSEIDSLLGGEDVMNVITEAKERQNAEEEKRRLADQINQAEEEIEQLREISPAPSVTEVTQQIQTELADLQAQLERRSKELDDADEDVYTI